MIEKFNYKLDSIGNEDLVFLLRNNKSLLCPFSKETDTTVECGSWCPHFNMVNDVNGDDIVMLSCSGTQINYILEETKT